MNGILFLGEFEDGLFILILRDTASRYEELGVEIEKFTKKSQMVSNPAEPTFSSVHQEFKRHFIVGK
jgi:hypothetical protein